MIDGSFRHGGGCQEINIQIFLIWPHFRCTIIYVAKYDAMKSVSETSAESKLSLSADSIDSDGMPFVDRHRASRSILKKSDSGSNYYSSIGNSDTEKLITDSMSTASICDNETAVCELPSNANNTRTRKRPVSPLLSRQVLESMFRTNNNTDREYMSVDRGRISITRTPKILFGDVEGWLQTSCKVRNA